MPHANQDSLVVSRITTGPRPTRTPRAGQSCADRGATFVGFFSGHVQFGTARTSSVRRDTMFRRGANEMRFMMLIHHDEAALAGAPHNLAALIELAEQLIAAAA